MRVVVMNGAPYLRKPIATALIAVLTALPAIAQQQPAPDLQQFGAVIDVRIINVDVVVTDRKGVPVKGLKKEDFELYENGRPVALSNFYEVAGGRPVATEGEEAAPAPS